MKQRTFLILMILLAVLLGSVIFALWRTFWVPASYEETVYISDEIQEEEIRESEPEGICWEDTRIEVGTLTYTITRASYLTNLIYDNCGSYRPSFWLAAILTAISGILFLILYRMADKLKEKTVE